MQTNKTKVGKLLADRLPILRWDVALLLAICVLLAGWGATARGQTMQHSMQFGTIRGKLLDANTQEPLIGANVFLQGTNIGAASDLDGNYTITGIPPGKYTLVAAYIGYARAERAEVVVRAGDVMALNFSLKEEVLDAGEEVVVRAKALKNSEGALLRERRLAAAVSDAISAEALSRGGIGDAAEAMGRVTGATIVGGKYVYVRGLGDRYTSTALNGSELPSSDPDRKAVHLDMFPSSLLENIVTLKTATPDRPGSFTGGMVNVATKSFPERLTLSFSASSSFNTQTSFKNNFLTYPGGNRDWLGMDDGARRIPNALKDPGVEIPDVGSAYTDPEAAQKLDQFTKSFSSVMAPTLEKAPANQSYSFSLGNQTSLIGRPLGYLGAVTYSRKFSTYDDGESGRYQLTGKVSEVDELNTDFQLSDSRSADEVLWGGMATLAYRPAAGHEVGINYVYNRSGEAVARYQSGRFPRDLTGDATYETRVLKFVERALRSLQLRGEHSIKGLRGMKVDWSGSASGSAQEEPDLRFFTNNYTDLTRNDSTNRLYSIRPDIYPNPTRYFRDLSEETRDLQVSFTFPLAPSAASSGKIKFGGAHLTRDRSFRERRFEFRQDKIRYGGDPKMFFSEENLGILEDESTDRFFRFGNFVVDATQPSSNYDGHQQIGAAYAMIDLSLFHRLRVLGGARFETTRMHVASQDTSLPAGEIETDDLLPSVNLSYALAEDMTMRLAYGRTLARPTFRELAPYASFDFVGDFIFIGNEQLKRTLTDNYDLRWEWFPRPGELFAISGFYKRFTHPIERVIRTVNGEIQYENVPEATVYGAEFEARKGLDLISGALKDFQLGGNLALVNSRVDIAPEELITVRSLDPLADGRRPLQGQSSYSLNLDLAYINDGSGTSASVHYNVFGPRLSEVSLGGTPNVFEQPRPVLDFVFSQELLGGLKVKVSAKNLLDSRMRKTHSYKDAEYVYQQFTLGRTFSIGTSYSIK